MNTMMDKPMFRFILNPSTAEISWFSKPHTSIQRHFGGNETFWHTSTLFRGFNPHNTAKYSQLHHHIFYTDYPQKKKQFLSDMHHVFWSNYFQICCLAHIFPLWHSFSACLCLSSLVFFSLGPWFTQDISLSLRVFVNGKAHVNSITQLCWITQT